MSRMAQTQRRRRRGAQDTTRTPRRSGYSPTRGSVLPSLARSATVALRSLMAVGYPGPTCSGAYCAPRATTLPVMSPPGTSCGWLFRHLRIPLLLPLSPHRTHKKTVSTHVPPSKRMCRCAWRGGGAGGGGACRGARSRGPPAPKQTMRLRTVENTSDPNGVVSGSASYSHSHSANGVPVLVHELPRRSAVVLGLRAAVTTKNAISDQNLALRAASRVPQVPLRTMEG